MILNERLPSQGRTDSLLAVKGPLGRVQHKLKMLPDEGFAVGKGALVHSLAPRVRHL